MILQYLHYHGGDSPLEPEVFQDFPNVSHFVPRENHRNPPETTGSMRWDLRCAGRPGAFDGMWPGALMTHAEVITKMVVFNGSL